MQEVELHLKDEKKHWFTEQCRISDGSTERVATYTPFIWDASLAMEFSNKSKGVYQFTHEGFTHEGGTHICWKRRVAIAMFHHLESMTSRLLLFANEPGFQAKLCVMFLALGRLLGTR